MITVDEINSAFVEAGKTLFSDIKRQHERRYGEMSDAASGMLTSVGFGAAFKLADGRIVEPKEIVLFLGMGLTPDEILNGMRSIKPQ